MSNLSAPSRKRLSELGLDAWRSVTAKKDEEKGRRGAAGGGAGGEDDDAGSETLRSHYSSSPHSTRSQSPGMGERRASCGAGGKALEGRHRGCACSFAGLAAATGACCFWGGRGLATTTPICAILISPPRRPAPPAGANGRPAHSPGASGSHLGALSPGSRASEISLRHLPDPSGGSVARASPRPHPPAGTPPDLTPRSARNMASAGVAGEDSLDAWSRLQPAAAPPSASGASVSGGGSKRVTFDSPRA